MSQKWYPESSHRQPWQGVKYKTLERVLADCCVVYQVGFKIVVLYGNIFVLQLYYLVKKLHKLNDWLLRINKIRKQLNFVQINFNSLRFVFLVPLYKGLQIWKFTYRYFGKPFENLIYFVLWIFYIKIRLQLKSLRTTALYNICIIE